MSVHLRAGDRNAFATANVTRCVDGHLRGGADRTVYVVACVEINHWFGTSRPNFEIL